MQRGAGRKHSTGMVSSETIVVAVVGVCNMNAIKVQWVANDLSKLGEGSIFDRS